MLHVRKVFICVISDISQVTHPTISHQICICTLFLVNLGTNSRGCKCLCRFESNGKYSNLVSLLHFHQNQQKISNKSWFESLGVTSFPIFLGIILILNLAGIFSMQLHEKTRLYIGFIPSNGSRGRS